MASRRRAGMQGDPAVGIAHGPSSSSHTGSRITSSCCVQRSCNEKLHASRTGRHSGQREQLLIRPFYSLIYPLPLDVAYRICTPKGALQVCPCIDRDRRTATRLCRSPTDHRRDTVRVNTTSIPGFSQIKHTYTTHI